MDAFIIKGGRRLRGTVRVHGSKNATLPLMAAALLTDEPVVLHDVPDLSDLRNMQKLLDSLGCRTHRDEATRTTTIHVTDPSKSLAHYDIVRTMRAGICALGPLLAKRGEAKVSMPGGCAIGDRPVDLHIRGLKALGAQIHLDEGYIVAKAPRGGRLIGTHVFLGGPNGSTVLGTANVMSAATLAEGVTVIECAACEPEIEDLANMLNGMGAKITGAGGPRVIIEGVDELKGADYTVMPDRIEAGTYVMAAAITNGEITLENFPTSALMACLDRLDEVGVTVRPVESAYPTNGNTPRPNGHGKKQTAAEGATATDVLTAARPASIKAATPAHAAVRWHDTVRVEVARRLSPVHVVTQPHPGFPTDLQAQIMALLCLADGNSIITEKIYPDRFLHVAEYLRMGANCLRNGPSVMVSGVKEMVGAPVMASDLRASAGLVLAGLAARGTTTINRVYHLDRGYERMETTLQQLGADIERVDLPGM